MVWDKNLPANSTKLRLSPAIFQANWDAIETGGVPYDTLQLSKQVAAPARQNNTGWIYGRDPGSGITELYYEDDQNPSVNIQLTSSGTMGASTTVGTFSSLAIGDTSTIADKNTVVIAWGKFNSSGALVYGKNMTAAAVPHPYLGTFDVNVDADFLINASYAVFGNVFHTGSDSSSVRALEPMSMPLPVVATPTTIRVRIRSASGLTNTLDYFFIQVIGGQ